MVKKLIAYKRSLPNYTIIPYHLLFSSTLPYVLASKVARFILISCHFLISCVRIDLTVTPISVLELPTIQQDVPTLAYWQRQHDNLGMTLYVLLLETIPSSAPRAQQIVKQGLHLGSANGFTVLQGILRHFHPRLASSIAPTYDSILQAPPVMTKPLKLQQRPYELSLVAYQAAHRDWIHQLSLYPEYHIRAKPSDFLLKFLHAVLPEYKPYLFSFENQLVRFGQRTKYQQPEPAIPVTFDANELDAILLGAAQTFDNQVGIHILPSKPISTQHLAAIDFRHVL